MNTRTNIFLSAVMIAAPLAAAADHTAIHTIEQQIAALQQQILALQAQPAPSAIPANPFSAALRRGSRHAEVTRLQEFLAAMPEFYPEGLVTGFFGPATERAVKRFQQTYAIPALGLVGPQTRAKLNELLAAKNIPPPAPAPAPEPAPAPAPTPPPSTSSGQVPPPPPAVSQVEPPTPVYIPTPEQLGMPAISAVVWGTDYASVQFAHDPGSYTRSYAVLRKKPDETTDTAFGPYAVPAVGTTTSAGDGITFQRLSVNAWEWRQALDLANQPTGDYTFTTKALGDGGAVGFPSPGRIATLRLKAEFDELLEGAPLRTVLNNTVTRFPITIRIKNFYTNLYYHYEIWDGATRVWDSAFLNTTTSSKIEAVFHNVNGYSFTAGKTYRLSVNAFDNNTGVPSTVKQPPGELVFTYQPSY